MKDRPQLDLAATALVRQQSRSVTQTQSIADCIEHMLNRIDVRPGERALDLATGTGWTARRLAQKGAQVTGVDIVKA